MKPSEQLEKIYKLATDIGNSVSEGNLTEKEAWIGLSQFIFGAYMTGEIDGFE